MGALWDQWAGESDTAYARFLRYRNLGPKRTHKKAYLLYLQTDDGFTGGRESLPKLAVPGSWRDESRDFEWPRRSAAWDVRNLQTYGSRLAVLHVQTITIIAGKNRKMAKRPDVTPESDCWPALVDSCRVVAEFLTPEIIASVQKGAELTRTAALPAGLVGGGKPVGAGEPGTDGGA